MAKLSSPSDVEVADFSIRTIISLPLLDRTVTLSRTDTIGDVLNSRLLVFNQELRDFGLSAPSVIEFGDYPWLGIFPGEHWHTILAYRLFLESVVPKNVDGVVEEFLSVGVNQMAVVTSLSPRPGEDVVKLLESMSTPATPPPSVTDSTANDDFTLRTVATLSALDFENHFPGTVSHKIIIVLLDRIALKLRRVLHLPSSISDSAGEFFSGFEVYPSEYYIVFERDHCQTFCRHDLHTITG
jgi:hypothetical protein